MMVGAGRVEGRVAGNGQTDRPAVLLVMPQPFFRSTGTPMNVRMICAALGDLGYRVELLTFPFGQELRLPHVVQSEVWGLPGLTRIPIGFSHTKVVYDLLLAGLVLGRLLRRRYAAVHAVEEAAFFTLPLARLRGLPAIMDLDSDLAQQLADHPSRLARSLAPWARRLRRRVLQLSQAALTVAPHLSALVQRESPTTPAFEIRDVPLPESLEPVDEAAVAALRQELALGPGPLAVYTGNLDRRQGVPELIEAWPEVRRACPAAQLLVVGGDPHEVTAYHQLAAEQLAAAGDERAISFAGKRPAAEMPVFMALADALVSPRLEPLVTPFKIYTYMASGRPIVATALPTHETVLGPASAFLVEPTPSGLARGLIAAFGDPCDAAARARAARALIDQRYNYGMFRQQLGTLYDHVVATAPAATRPALDELRR